MTTLTTYETPWDFFSQKSSYALNNKSFPVGFFELVAHMAKDANYNLQTCYVDIDRMFIAGKIGNKTNELMLRYNHGTNNALVVARIRFIHRRKGNMTELYQILKRIQRKYHTGPIVIESVQTDEMEAWCKKFNFTETFPRSTSYIEPVRKG